MQEIARLGQDYAGKDIGMVAVSSNDAVNYPDDAPDKLAEMANSLQLTFPFLYDESQQVAKAYKAACTPDFFLFDRSRKLVYRGRLDESRPGNERPVDGRDLRAAMENLLADRPIEINQEPSLGCNIKWKPGQAPDTF
jgi:hypothetical protein